MTATPIEPGDPRSKAELIERTTRARAALAALIAPLTDEQMARPGGPDGWAVRDHLAHITAWQRSLVALLRGQPRKAAMGIDVATAAAGTDAINALVYERNRDRPPAEVLAEFRAASAEVLTVLAPLNDDDLLLPYSHYQPDDPPYNPRPVMGWVAGNTCDHFDEHTGWLRTLIASLPTRERQ